MSKFFGAHRIAAGEQVVLFASASLNQPHGATINATLTQKPQGGGLSGNVPHTGAAGHALRLLLACLFHRLGV